MTSALPSPQPERRETVPGIMPLLMQWKREGLGYEDVYVKLKKRGTPIHINQLRRFWIGIKR